MLSFFHRSKRRERYPLPLMKGSIVMKKLTALILALTMMLSLTACSGGSKVKLQILATEYAVEDYAICIAKENAQLLAEVNEALATLMENGTAQKIVDHHISGVDHGLTFQQNAEGKEVLHMATEATFPPYEYYEDGKIVGLDVDMAMAIADELDMKLEIEDMAFDSIITAVSTGKADIGMAGMTVTEDRLESVNFSASYATGIQSIIVPEGSAITCADDLYAEDAQFIVGTQKGTTGDIYAEGDFGAERVSKFTKGTDAIQALVTGKVDCVIIDNEPAKAFVAANNG